MTVKMVNAAKLTSLEECLCQKVLQYNIAFGFAQVTFTLLFAVCAVKGAVGQHQFSHPGSIVPALQSDCAVQEGSLQCFPCLLSYTFTGRNPVG